MIHNPQIHYQGTGEVILKNITPVIKCLFGPFGIKKNTKRYPVRCTIVVKHENDILWSAIQNNLVYLIKKLGQFHWIKADQSIINCLNTLADLYIQSKKENSEFKDRINYISFKGVADLKILHYLALNLNDGHGLELIYFESAKYSDEFQLDAFGGEFIYINPAFKLERTISDIRKCANIVGQAVFNSDLVSTSNWLYAELDNLLDNIKDKSFANKVKIQLAYLFLHNSISRE